MNQRLGWIDVETTGLEAGRHRVIEVYAEVTDRDLNVLDSYESKVALSMADFEAAEPKALQVNRYNADEWRGAPLPTRELWSRVHSIMDRVTPAGQNVEFDLKFLSAEMIRVGLSPTWSRRKLDVMSFGIVAMMEHDLKSASLDVIYQALGGPPVDGHRAKPDVKRAQFLYRMQLQGYRMLQGAIKTGAVVAGQLDRAGAAAA